MNVIHYDNYLIHLFTDTLVEYIQVAYLAVSHLLTESFASNGARYRNADRQVDCFTTLLHLRLKAEFFSLLYL